MGLAATPRLSVFLVRFTGRPLTKPCLARLENRIRGRRGGLRKIDFMKNKPRERRLVAEYAADAVQGHTCELTTLDATYGIMGKLAEVARGDNSARLRFHRFVLTSLLDDMRSGYGTSKDYKSRGRYHLLRQLEHEVIRSFSGFDLGA